MGPTVVQASSASASSITGRRWHVAPTRRAWGATQRPPSGAQANMQERPVMLRACVCGSVFALPPNFLQLAHWGFTHLLAFALFFFFIISEAATCLCGTCPSHRIPSCPPRPAPQATAVTAPPERRGDGFVRPRLGIPPGRRATTVPSSSARAASSSGLACIVPSARRSDPGRGRTCRPRRTSRRTTAPRSTPAATYK